MKARLEICSYSVESAINAQKGGADRIELCGGRLEGGTTPSWGMIQQARKHLQIKLHIIIRPRGGDFVYSDLELEEMLQDIRMAKDLGCDGIVIGVLTNDGYIHKEACKRLIEEALPMSVTFHRAFDMVVNPQETLEELIELGVNSVLTSGQAMFAVEGLDILKELVNQANGRIEIIPASGVNPSNIQKIQQTTAVQWLHSSASKIVESKMRYRNENVAMSKEANTSEFEYTRVDRDLVLAMKQQISVTSDQLS